MWSSRISILKTVLEMADIWHFANKKKTNLSQRACKIRAMEGSGPEQRHFLRPFLSQRTEKLLAGCASSRKEGMAIFR